MVDCVSFMVAISAFSVCTESITQVSLLGKLYSITPADEVGQVFSVCKGIFTFFLIKKSNFQKLCKNSHDI